MPHPIDEDQCHSLIDANLLIYHSMNYVKYTANTFTSSIVLYCFGTITEMFFTFRMV